jgi:hypothetical protein
METEAELKKQNTDTSVRFGSVQDVFGLGLKVPTSNVQVSEKNEMPVARSLLARVSARDREFIFFYIGIQINLDCLIRHLRCLGECAAGRHVSAQLVKVTVRCYGTHSIIMTYV